MPHWRVACAQPTLGWTRVHQVRHGARTAARHPGGQPPPFTATRLLTEWNLEWWMALGMGVAAALYPAGLAALRRRGVRWPVRRSISFFVGGLGPLALATLSALGAYDTVLFSVHVVQHMILMMLAPLFIALGAPVTLALRTLPAGPGSCFSPCCTHGWPAC